MFQSASQFIFFNFPAIAIALVIKVIAQPFEGIINPYIFLGISYPIMLAVQGGIYYYIGRFISYLVLPKLKHSPEPDTSPKPDK